MNSLERRILALAASVFLAASLAACGDESPPRQSISGGNNGSSDVGSSDGDDMDAGDVITEDGGTDDTETTDTSATDTAEDAEDTQTQEDGGDSNQTGDTGETGSSDCSPGDCADGELCVEGDCVAETAELKCRSAQDLGQLQVGTQSTVSDSLFDQTDVLTTVCGQQAEGGERVYKFTVDEVAELSFSATWEGQFDGLLDFRTGDCASGSTSGDRCFDSENENIVVEPGEDYFMVVEHTIGRAGDFTVTLDLSPLTCVPGTMACSNETLERCSGDGQQYESFNCAASCSAAQGGSTSTSCAGDACAGAIQINGAGTYVGDINAYQTNYDFGQISGCEVEGTPVPTPGAEVVFKISGAPAGAEFQIDAATNDTNNNAIFVTSNCGAPATLTCVESYLSNEEPIFTVPMDNTDYYVFIDKTSNTGTRFHYQIGLVTNNP